MLENKREKAILALVNDGHLPSVEKTMEELVKLVEAAGADSVFEMIQNKEHPERSTYLGQGKLDELAEQVELYDADLVVFGEELSGIQIKNIEKVVDVKVLDRTGLILDIFAQRAQSREGKLQVELAQLRYRLPRLIGSNKHLSRTGGGIGTRGPGETKLEMDRRAIKDKIHKLKDNLKEVEERRIVSRKQRSKADKPIIALVGYTNAGKSTLMNVLSVHTEDDYKVLEKDMLFATLDTTLRRGCLLNGKEFLLVDTVGFVSDLPHYLVAAFKSTLEELKYADLIVHVMDGHETNLEMQKTTTKQVLEELGVLDKPCINIYNKKDLVDDLIEKESKTEDGFWISAKDNGDKNRLLEEIEKVLKGKFQKKKLLIPYSQNAVLSKLHEIGEVNICEYIEEGTIVETTLNEADSMRYQKYEYNK